MDYILTLKKIRPYTFHIATFTMLILVLLGTQNICMGTLSDMTVYGNCQQLQDRVRDQTVLENLGIGDGISSPDGMIQYIKPHTKQIEYPGRTMQLDNDIITINKTTTTTSTTTTTTTTIPCPTPTPCKCSCPICTVTACPKLDNQQILTEVNTWRPEGAPAVQHGWYQMRSRLITYLGGKASKYREGPSISYQSVKTKEETHVFQILKDNNECFTLSQYPDLNGRKRWNWNCNDGSNITICHL